jgi:hypothetical protein
MLTFCKLDLNKIDFLKCKKKKLYSASHVWIITTPLLHDLQMTHIPFGGGNLALDTDFVKTAHLELSRHSLTLVRRVQGVQFWAAVSFRRTKWIFVVHQPHCVGADDQKMSDFIPPKLNYGVQRPVFAAYWNIRTFQFLRRYLIKDKRVC